METEDGMDREQDTDGESMSDAPRAGAPHATLADAVNEATNYTMYAVFRAARRAEGAPGATDAILSGIGAIEGVTVRGWYDVAGLRADADILLWTHGGRVEDLQAGYRAVLDGARGALEPVWSAVGVHRPAEFNKGHIPAFLAGEAPAGYLCCYPFVRGREWYLLRDAERSDMLREHGMAARDYRDVLSNTVASFGLGDYEWLLALEADDLTRLVDLIRDLRATSARRHVIEETPFFTGPRVEPRDLLGRVLRG